MEHEGGRPTNFKKHAYSFERVRENLVIKGVSLGPTIVTVVLEI